MIWGKILLICSQAGQITRKTSSSTSPKDPKARCKRTNFLKIQKNMKIQTRKKPLKQNSQTS